MKPFSERNPLRIGLIGIGLILVLMFLSVNYDKLPFFNKGATYSAYFAEAGGLMSGNIVQVSGFRVGQVSSVELDGPRVLVKFDVANNIRLGDLTTTISGLDTNQLSKSLAVLADTFSNTPPDLKAAAQGVARFSQTLDERDAQLRNLLSNADKATK